MPACNKCNEHRGIFELDSAGVCKSCRQREEREWKDDGAQSPVHPITITTANSIPGIDTYEIVDIVTAECAFGMNLFRDMFAGVRDIFGGRSGATQKVLRDARTTALDQLRREAHTLGANAIIGVDLDYSEFSGGRKSMLFIVASGTAIKTKS